MSDETIRYIAEKAVDAVFWFSLFFGLGWATRYRTNIKNSGMKSKSSVRRCHDD